MREKLTRHPSILPVLSYAEINRVESVDFLNPYGPTNVPAYAKERLAGPFIVCWSGLDLIPGESEARLTEPGHASICLWVRQPPDQHYFRPILGLVDRPFAQPSQ